MIAGGYAGRILDVDLSNKKLGLREIDDKTARKYLGGTGLAAKILWDETTATTSPLSPEAPLMFMVGPLTGTAMPSSSRHFVAGLSPLTGIWGEAHSGGDWADELKHAGFDGVVVRGRAEKPVYLWLHNGEVDIRDASHLWGKDTYAMDELLRQETDQDARVAGIGPAGEKMVKVACVMNDGKMGRAAARCGLGAVMGSKNLKAIVVRGTQRVNTFDEAKLKKIVADIYAINPPKQVVAKTVDSSVVRWRGFVDTGRIPVKNWQHGTFTPVYDLIEAVRKSQPYFCRHCPYGDIDSRLTADGSERYMVLEHWAPLGTNCLIGDVGALQEAYVLCQKYGMDSISIGGVIAFAMECYEKGLITKRETGGIDLSWGNHKGMLEMLRQIGENEGFGSVLGEGVRQAAERIGGMAREYAIHGKGLEFPFHDPRSSVSFALQYATASHGAFHNEAMGATRLESHYTKADGNLYDYVVELSKDLGYTPKLTASERLNSTGKGELIAKTQNMGNVINSLGICILLITPGKMRLSQLIPAINSVTGWDMDTTEFLTTGERIFNLKRMLNVRRGISRKDDVLPLRILTHRRRESDTHDNLPHLGAMLSEYYALRGWSEEGIPTREKLMALGLEECLKAD